MRVLPSLKRLSLKTDSLLTVHLFNSAKGFGVFNALLRQVLNEQQRTRCDFRVVHISGVNRSRKSKNYIQGAWPKFSSFRILLPDIVQWGKAEFNICRNDKETVFVMSGLTQMKDFYLQNRQNCFNSRIAKNVRLLANDFNRRFQPTLIRNAGS